MAMDNILEDFLEIIGYKSTGKEDFGNRKIVENTYNSIRVIDDVYQICVRVAAFLFIALVNDIRYRNA